MRSLALRCRHMPSCCRRRQPPGGDSAARGRWSAERARRGVSPFGCYPSRRMVCGLPPLRGALRARPRGTTRSQRLRVAGIGRGRRSVRAQPAGAPPCGTRAQDALPPQDALIAPGCTPSLGPDGPGCSISVSFSETRTQRFLLGDSDCVAAAAPTEYLSRELKTSRTAETLEASKGHPG
jgi:hypothetical protein